MAWDEGPAEVGTVVWVAFDGDGHPVESWRYLKDALADLASDWGDHSPALWKCEAVKPAQQPTNLERDG